MSKRLRFLKNRRGHVALITALCAPFLLSSACFAIDYGYASYIKQSLDAAMDTAVLAAVSQSAATAGGGYGDTSFLQAYAIKVFASNTAKLPVTGVSATVTVTPNGTGGVTASGSYTYNSPTFFIGVFGIHTINASGTVQSAVNPLTYINYYILVDISQSMGIAATQTDMNNLYTRVQAYGNGTGGEPGCVFGCHVAEASQSYTNEYLAHGISPKITLRIDSAVSAIQSIISDAQLAAGSNNNIKIALYTISKDPVTGKLLNVIAPLSSNYANLTTQAATIDLGNNVAGGDGDSDFADELTQFSSTVLPTNGSGVSAASPKNYVFIVTDGLIDTPGNCTSGHCTGAFNSANCATLKANATVGVIYTTYLPIYNYNNSAYGLENNYASLAAPYVNQIPTNLQSCATSSSYYYQASDGPSITTAMKALFASSLQTARLTQ